MKHINLNKPENYLTSNKLTHIESSMLFNLRCRVQTEFKDNFHKIHENRMCPLCSEENDTQEHALACSEVTQRLGNKLEGVEYTDLFGNVESQAKVVKAYKKVINLRKILLEPEGIQDAPTGATIPDPATTNALCTVVQRK